MALDANLRLSRSEGDIQLVTYHKPSDPLSAGNQGSQAAQLQRTVHRRTFWSRRTGIATACWPT